MIHTECTGIFDLKQGLLDVILPLHFQYVEKGCNDYHTFMECMSQDLELRIAQRKVLVKVVTDLMLASDQGRVFLLAFLDPGAPL